ncbi:hypothetical protein [Rarobacter incanus]|uniref:Uncharacterized protein n=1 Tax=Rarobacter incanus TaxID=153494 RepID=A0A542SPF4_9MICO|nr:hypothetical protein [Rarobacter incanus]TQK76445.1 hypothetical protein FB389_1117 [Rarobacter incanus]
MRVSDGIDLAAESAPRRVLRAIGIAIALVGLSPTGREWVAHMFTWYVKDKAAGILEQFAPVFSGIIVHP